MYIRVHIDHTARSSKAPYPSWLPPPLPLLTLTMYNWPVYIHCIRTVDRKQYNCRRISLEAYVSTDLRRIGIDNNGCGYPSGGETRGTGQGGGGWGSTAVSRFEIPTGSYTSGNQVTETPSVQWRDGSGEGEGRRRGGSRSVL